jgi:photosynthetic reaction center H subunit
MMRGAITNNIDVAQVVLYAFFIFFAGLVFYLRREDRREGYPLESEASGRAKDRGFLLIPEPKTFLLHHGGSVQAPRFDRDAFPAKAEKVEPWPGAPIQPVGDPMLAEVGPGSYAQRADVTEKTWDGRDLIVPTRVATNFTVAPEDTSPVGFAVIGADRKCAGVVNDLWVDRGEAMLRYYEVALESGRTVLLPVTFSRVSFANRQINVDALLASQFANVPSLRDPDKITLLEEEKVTAYYGAGTLYATAARSEPLL